MQISCLGESVLSAASFSEPFARKAVAVLRERWVESGLQDPAARIVAGGKVDDSEGSFVWPTLIEVNEPRHRLMTEEIKENGKPPTDWRYPFLG
jgi:acyl-CoA reductase-like NAD-dependent aldehyde dehydrogenase